MITYSRCRNGIAIIPKASTESDTKGELEFLTSTDKLYVNNGSVNDPVVTETVAATLTNKILSGNTAVTLISGSGILTLNTSGTVTLPNATDTLVGKATTDTLTNKVLTGNTAVNLISGSGTMVLNTSGTITLPNGTDTLAGLALAQTLTNKSMDGNNNTFTNLPSGALPADVVYLDATQTLTNKTLTAPIIATIVNTGTITLPTATTTLVGRNTTDTLTNKTLSGNTAVTLISGSGTLTLNTSGTVTLPNATDTLVGKATTDTLTNKTLTSPVLNTPTADTITGIAGAALTLQPASGQNLALNSNGAGLISHDNITFKTNTIATSTGALTINPVSGNNLFLNGSGSGTIQLQRSGSTILTIDTGGLTLASGKTLGISTGTLALNTSGAITVPNATDTLVGKTTTDTLTNKTLTSPVINSATADTVNGIAGTDLTLYPATNREMYLTSNGTGKVNLDNVSVKTNTISTVSGSLTINPVSGSNLLLNGSGTGTIQLMRAGVAIATVDTAGVTLASGKTLVLTNNGQTATIQANASASASYTISTPAAAPGAGTAWVYNGTTYVWASAGGWTTGSSTSLAAGGTVSISLTTGQQVYLIASSGGVVSLSATPFGTSAPSDGVSIRLIGTSDANAVTLTNNDAAKGCILNGSATLGKGCVIELQYMTTSDRYYETSRNF